MLKAFKTEINPTNEQKAIINRTIGVTRFVANQYLAHVTEVYNLGGSYVDYRSYTKWLNNTFIPMNPEFSWIKEVYQKSVKQGLSNVHQAFMKFFKGESDYPNFKTKKNQKTKMYFVKNDKNHVIEAERHRIKIPTLGWLRLKEKGYIPKHSDTIIIKSGTISRKADKYFISVLVQIPDNHHLIPNRNNSGIGGDMGIKDTLICSNDVVYPNINHTSKVKKLERKLKHEQKKLSRMYEINVDYYKTIGYTNQKVKGKINRIPKRKPIWKRPLKECKNIQKQQLVLQKIYLRLSNIRNDYQNKIVNNLAKTKPNYITIENLNVKGMLKNKHLSKAISKQSLYTLRTKLIWKASQGYFELREVSRWYPSSKLCNRCGEKKHNLKLKDRIFKCEHCGYENDRDSNASLNLKDATVYTVLAG